jgi:outer membrane protein OmpA-like peptidoglycan-associated protein
LAKRIEVYVNVKGCILCVDGVQSLNPGVTENLTAGHQMGTLLTNIELERAELDKRIQIQHIYYDFDKWDIRTDAAERLDFVVTLMNDNPGLKVELGSHTDSRGNDDYNLALSARRAAAAVAYIVSEGVDSARITSKGYGESQPVNRCRNGVSCTEGEHQQNRRTELRITGVSGDPLEYLHWPSLEQIVREEERTKTRKMRATASNAPPPPAKVELAEAAAPPPSVPPATQTQQNPKPLREINPRFKGFSIELMRSDSLLPAADGLLRAYSDVFWQRDTAGKFCYFTGHFDTAAGARNYLNKKIKPQNMQARPVRFIKAKKQYLD